MRKLSKKFLKALSEGELKNLLDYIRNDKELDIQIRNNYINIYYKGGNILKINSPKSFDFDKMYFNDYHKLNSTKAKNNPELMRKYKEQQEELLSLVPSNPEEYFEQAKKVMDKWDNALKDVIRHDERKEQHLIACKNRNSKEYAVLDIEYSVSRKSKFSYNGELDKVVPRFDIIAIHDSKLVVIELKKGLGAINGDSGIEQHKDCFEHTIGRDNELRFVKEMQELLEQKQELGLLESLKINNEKPIFVFAFADKKEESEFDQFKKICNQKGYIWDLIYVNSNHQFEKR